MGSIASILACCLFLAQQPAVLPALSGKRLVDQIQYRAWLFFKEQADPRTGLVKDRARNDDTSAGSVASIAATGYGLAALPVAVEHGWIPRAEAETRAIATLRFATDHLPGTHGWYYHFVDSATGARQWQCEVSSIDTALLLNGALVCGRYFHGEPERLAESLYARVDWTWMRTNGGEKPGKMSLSMGWKPESGFLESNWDTYSEGMILYLLGMGAPRNPLPPESWRAWSRNTYSYGGMTCLGGGPIFLNQMVHGFFNLRGQRDSLGIDYWASGVNATRMNRQFCIDHAATRRTYGPDIWGLNASDGPKGYMAYGIPSPEDGTVCPTGAIASIIFTPDLSTAAADAMYARYRSQIWVRYGFADAFNVDANWYDTDVIGIDLGMALLAIENHRTGLIWRLMSGHPAIRRAMRLAGFQTVGRMAQEARRQRAN